MFEKLRKLPPEALEALDYFTPSELEERLALDGYTKRMATRVMNGFKIGEGYRSIREVVELPDNELYRGGWTGQKSFKAIEQAIINLLRSGTRID